MMWNDGWDGADWFLMMITMVALWGGLIALIVWLVQGTRRDQTPTPRAAPPPGPAEDLLAERFARGEIDSEEFTKRRALLRSDR